MKLCKQAETTSMYDKLSIRLRYFSFLIYLTFLFFRPFLAIFGAKVELRSVGLIIWKALKKIKNPTLARTPIHSISNKCGFVEHLIKIPFFPKAYSKKEINTWSIVVLLKIVILFFVFTVYIWIDFNWERCFLPTNSMEILVLSQNHPFFQNEFLNTAKYSIQKIHTYFGFDSIWALILIWFDLFLNVEAQLTVCGWNHGQKSNTKSGKYWSIWKIVLLFTAN